MDPTDFAQKTNQYVTDYIKFADAKATAVLGFVAGLGAFLATTGKVVLASARAAGDCAYLLGLSVAALLLVSTVYCLWQALAAINPRTPSSTPHSLHSFPTLAVAEPNELIAQLGSLTHHDILAEYTKHNVILSSIAMRKYESLKHAVHGLRVALVAGVAFALIYTLAALANPELAGAS